MQPINQNQEFIGKIYGLVIKSQKTFEGAIMSAAPANEAQAKRLCEQADLIYEDFNKMLTNLLKLHEGYMADMGEL